MDINLPVINQYRTKFSEIWNAALQQDTSILESYVTIMPDCAGDKIELPYLGSTELNERTSRLQKVEPVEMQTGKRHMKPIQFEKFVMMSTDDKLFMDRLDLTSSQIVAEQRKAAARVRDMIILGVKKGAGNTYVIRDSTDGATVGGILAANYTGNGGTTLTPFDPSQIVAADYVAKGSKVTSGLTLEKIIEAKRMLESADAWHEGMGDTLCMAITPAEKAQMLMWHQQQSKDFGFSVLEHGKIHPMLGINFLVTNMLPLDEAGNRICPMWLKSKVILGAWEQPKFRIDVRQDYIDAVQVGVTCGYGAARKGEKEFVQVLCKSA